MDAKQKAVVDALRPWLVEFDKEQSAIYQLSMMVRELWLEAVDAKAAEKKPAKADK